MNPILLYSAGTGPAYNYYRFTTKQNKEGIHCILYIVYYTRDLKPKIFYSKNTEK